MTVVVGSVIYKHGVFWSNFFPVTRSIGRATPCQEDIGSTLIPAARTPAGWVRCQHNMRSLEAKKGRHLDRLWWLAMIVLKRYRHGNSSLTAKRKTSTTIPKNIPVQFLFSAYPFTVFPCFPSTYIQPYVQFDRSSESE